MSRLWRGRTGLVARGVAPFVAVFLALYFSAGGPGVSGALGAGYNGGDASGLGTASRSPGRDLYTGGLRPRGDRRGFSLRGRRGLRLFGDAPAGRRVYDGLRHRQDAPGPQAHLPLSTAGSAEQRRRPRRAARSAGGGGGLRSFDGGAGRRVSAGGGRGSRGLCPARLGKRGEAAHDRAGVRGHARGDRDLPGGHRKRAGRGPRSRRRRREDHVLRLARPDLAGRGARFSNPLGRPRPAVSHSGRRAPRPRHGLLRPGRTRPDPGRRVAARRNSGRSRRFSGCWNP